MSRMRKLLVLVIPAMLLLAVACGGGGGGQTGARPGQGETPQLTNPATVPTSTPVDGALTFVIRDNGVSAPDGTGMAVTGQPTPSSGSRGVYTIVSGDTCFGIADTLGTTVPELEEANVSLDCGALQPGVELRIPAGSTAGSADGDADETPTAGETPTPAASGGGATYTIQSGDLCGDIAASYGVDVDALVALNGLDCNNLQVGQTIQIP
jgi:LysM repeat protein